MLFCVDTYLFQQEFMACLFFIAYFTWNKFSRSSTTKHFPSTVIENFAFLQFRIAIYVHARASHLKNFVWCKLFLPFPFFLGSVTTRTPAPFLISTTWSVAKWTLRRSMSWPICKLVSRWLRVSSIWSTWWRYTCWHCHFQLEKRKRLHCLPCCSFRRRFGHVIPVYVPTFWTRKNGSYFCLAVSMQTVLSCKAYSFPSCQSAF